eukprot:6212829-Pleurochrysis_carterae.AAC.2
MKRGRGGWDAPTQWLEEVGLGGAAAAMRARYPRAWEAERERSSSARDDNLQVNVERERRSNCKLLGLVGKTLDIRSRSRYRWILRYDQLR